MMIMTIKDLKKVTSDKVYLYKKLSDGEYEDLYQGKIDDVPAELLDSDVMYFGAKRKDFLDIRIA